MMISSQNNLTSVGNANDFKTEEKRERRQLKTELKRQRKIFKLEKRIRHAIQGKNPSLEEQARKELKEIMLSGESLNCVATNGNFLIDSTLNSNPIHVVEASSNSLPFSPLVVDKLRSISSDTEETKRFILGICNHLTQFYHYDAWDNERNQQLNHGNIAESAAIHKPKKSYDARDKVEQVNNCRKLMRQMSTGTQTKESFRNNPQILWEYTRQKFLERAMLVFTSLSKLQPLNSGSYTGESCVETWKQRRMWEQIQKVRHACSLGSGPGNDLVGLVAFLRKQHQLCCKHRPPQRGNLPNQSTAAMTLQDKEATEDKIIDTSDAILHTAVALDWVEEEWRCIVEPLQNLLAPTFIRHFTTQSFDVTQPLYSTENDVTHDAPPCNSRNRSALICATKCDIFLISYLLTENRGRWEVFCRQLFHAAKKGALFYFAEPTSWQLHILLHMMKPFRHCDDTTNKQEDINDVTTDMLFLWLDSSMNFPDLQVLNGRLGPAVLLGMKT
jgi:hypothetical protein